MGDPVALEFGRNAKVILCVEMALQGAASHRQNQIVHPGEHPFLMDAVAADVCFPDIFHHDIQGFFRIFEGVTPTFQ